jgi:hypothetical protein
MCCGLEVESLAATKNACDTVVAAFFDVNHARYRDAFHPQARSHRTITALRDGIEEDSTQRLADTDGDTPRLISQECDSLYLDLYVYAFYKNGLSAKDWLVSTTTSDRDRANVPPCVGERIMAVPCEEDVPIFGP